METEKLYWKDAYLKEFHARVVNVIGNAFILDKTAFYPGGGGQPCDTGKIIVLGAEFPVTAASEKDGLIYHAFDSNYNLMVGSDAKGLIDWGKRYAYMRHHTALHIIGAVIEKKEPTSISTGGQIYADKARIDFDMPGLNRELAAKLIDEANAVVNEAREVRAAVMPREEALKIPNLARTGPGRRLIESLETVRVVEINGIDVQADGGTHVASTKEVGRISLLKFENNGSHNKRLTIALENAMG